MDAVSAFRESVLELYARLGLRPCEAGNSALHVLAWQLRAIGGCEL